MSKIKIAIIGAGVSGLTCADALRKNPQIDVCVFEKSRGVGGRTATRRSGEYRFDLGFQVYPAPLAAPLASLSASWDNKIVPIPSSNSYCKKLAEAITVQSDVEIKKIEHNTQWILHSATETFGPFDFVILTAPPLQTHTLLPDAISFKKNVAVAQMSPCFSLMVTCKSLLTLPWKSLSPHHAVIQWVSHQSTLPERDFDKSLFVAHTTPAWSKQHLEAPMEEISSQLAQEFKAVTTIPEDNYESWSVHRWRYAFTEKPVGTSHLFDKKSKLGVCGDWLTGHTFLDAQSSALALAKDLLSSI